MSRQSEAKEAQGYRAPKDSQRCEICYFFEYDRTYSSSMYPIDKNLRCGAGNFAVKKMSSCNKFTEITDSPY